MGPLIVRFHGINARRAAIKDCLIQFDIFFTPSVGFHRNGPRSMEMFVQKMGALFTKSYEK